MTLDGIEQGLKVQKKRIEKERHLRELREGMSLDEVIRRANDIPWPYTKKIGKVRSLRDRGEAEG